MVTKEQILAGEFLSKLGNKKSRFIVQLICDYLNAHPEAMDAKETMQFIVNSTAVGERLTDMIRSIIQTEFAVKLIGLQSQVIPEVKLQSTDIDTSISSMLENLDIWNID